MGDYQKYMNNQHRRDTEHHKDMIREEHCHMKDSVLDLQLPFSIKWFLTCINVVPDFYE